MAETQETNNNTEQNLDSVKEEIQNKILKAFRDIFTSQNNGIKDAIKKAITNNNNITGTFKTVVDKMLANKWKEAIPDKDNEQQEQTNTNQEGSKESQQGQEQPAPEQTEEKSEGEKEIDDFDEDEDGWSDDDKAKVKELLQKENLTDEETRLLNSLENKAKREEVDPLAERLRLFNLQERMKRLNKYV